MVSMARDHRTVDVQTTTAALPDRDSDSVEEYNALSLVIDITAVSGQSMITGVQRIVREFAEAAGDEAVLVRFHPKSGVFRIVRRVPRLRYRTTTGFIGRLRLRLKNFYWSFSSGFREQGTRRRYMPSFVRNAARRFYDTFLSDSRLEKETALQNRPEWVPQPHQTFVLLDIPVAPTHVEALVDLAESHDVRFVVYLHDLMPLSHRHLFNRQFHPGVRARHLRYLDVINASSLVVCNSAHTKAQYERFTTLLETAPDQSVRVVYPPWPAFAQRSDGSSDTVARVFPDAETRILSVGALDVRKNMALLVRALKIMAARGDDVHLAIVSGVTAAVDPEFTAALLELSESERERLTILQSVSDDRLVELYDRATVVAVPSLAEGFGLPVVEGVARGCPVVAADATALPELAALFPVTLVDPTDAAAWADALVATSRAGLAGPVSRPEQIPADWDDFRARLFAT
jgi:glycosyltransferase involved in cell wall biosynthesis